MRGAPNHQTISIVPELVFSLYNTCTEQFVLQWFWCGQFIAITHLSSRLSVPFHCFLWQHEQLQNDPLKKNQLCCYSPRLWPLSQCMEHTTSESQSSTFGRCAITSR